MHDGDPTEHRTLTELVPKGMVVAMVMTMVGRSHTSRPVTVAETREGRLSFLVARNAEWVKSIAGQAAIVHVTIAHDDTSKYLSLNGDALVVEDVAEVERLWSPAARAWFDGPDDPELAVMHFDVSDGDYWDGPTGRVARAAALVRAMLTGNGDDVGDSGPVIGR